MPRRVVLLTLGALATTGNAQLYRGDGQLLRGLFFGSESSSWSPDASQQVVEERHEVSTEMMPIGGVMQETRSRVDCINGACTKTVEVSNPTQEIMPGRLPRMVHCMLNHMRSMMHRMRGMHTGAQVDGFWPTWFSHAAEQGPRPAMIEVTVPLMRLPDDDERAPRPVFLAPRAVGDALPGWARSSMDTPVMVVDLDAPEQALQEPHRPAAAVRPAMPVVASPVVPAAIALVVLMTSATIVAMASCKCLRAQSREMPLTAALGQPLAPATQAQGMHLPAIAPADAGPKAEAAPAEAVPEAAAPAPGPSELHAYLLGLYARVLAA